MQDLDTAHSAIVVESLQCPRELLNSGTHEWLEGVDESEEPQGAESKGDGTRSKILEVAVETTAQTIVPACPTPAT